MNLYEVRILSADAAAPTPQRRARRQRRNEQTAAGAAAAVTDAHHRSGIGNRYLFLCADLWIYLKNLQTGLELFALENKPKTNFVKHHILTKE